MIGMTGRMRLGRLAAVAGVLALVLGFLGCAGRPTSTSGGPGTTDELFKDQVSDAKFYVFQIGDLTLTADNYYDVDVSNGEPLRDGSFYQVVADVTYLNGGVAGYVDFPQVRQVKSCTEVSPFDMGLPSLKDKTYGLTLIGDYADGDVLFYERSMMAVWKDGSWLHRFDHTIELSDGTVAGVREGVTEADVQAGVQSGVLSCEDYFALLPDRSGS